MANTVLVDGEIGVYSTAVGTSSSSQGIYSTAIGVHSKAYGHYSVAMGMQKHQVTGEELGARG